MQMTKFNSIRSFCSNKVEDNSIAQDLNSGNIKWRPIYNMPKISAVRLIHRLKIYQSIFTIGVAPVTLGFYYCGKTNVTTALVLTGVASFTCLSLYAITLFFKRLIGIIYIDKDQKLLKIAHLTFWGGRNDIIVPVDKIIPLTDCDNNPADIFVKLVRTNSDESLYMTLRFGKILDEDVFKKVFGNLEVLKSQ